MTIREKDHGSEELIRRMGQRALLKVGVMGSEAAAKKNVRLSDGSVVSTGETVADIATYHELGLGVPKRSFIADCVDEDEESIKNRLRESARKVLEGGSLKLEISLLGAEIQGAIQERIANGIAPELADATIDRKGSSVPLVDTGQLKSSVTWDAEITQVARG